MEFRDFCSTEGMSITRIERCMIVLKKWAKILDKNFSEATKEDIMRAVRIIQENSEYAPWTKSTYKIMLKRHFKWLKNSTEMPLEVKWINSHLKKSEEKLPSNGELLSESEIRRAVDAAEHHRDKALISILYESGARIGELASLQICNIKFDEYGATLMVTGKTGSSIEISSNVLTYSLAVIFVLIGLFSYADSLEGLGLGIGLLSAVFGLALQKPITWIAAWIMVISKRPFDIGDRVIIGTVKGDVVDITLSHIYIAEIGGNVPGEEISGRIILVPNSILFEQNIINYTPNEEYVFEQDMLSGKAKEDQYILDQVIVTITYESNLDKALKLLVDSVEKATVDYKAKAKPYARSYFQASGVELHVRYFVPSRIMQSVSSEITRDIFARFKKQSDIKIGYPHTEVLLRKK